jgi:hypothetical protein
VPTAAKARLLEWKIRYDLVQHVARSSVPYQVGRRVDYSSPSSATVEGKQQKKKKSPHRQQHN